MLQEEYGVGGCTVLLDIFICVPWVSQLISVCSMSASPFTDEKTSPG